MGSLGKEPKVQHGVVAALPPLGSASTCLFFWVTDALFCASIYRILSASKWSGTTGHQAFSVWDASNCRDQSYSRSLIRVCVDSVCMQGSGYL